MPFSVHLVLLQLANVHNISPPLHGTVSDFLLRVLRVDRLK